MNRFDTFFLCRNLSFSSNTNFRSNLLIVLIIRNILFSCMVLSSRAFRNFLVERGNREHLTGNREQENRMFN